MTLRASHKADVACLEHALDQLEYAKSGGAFTYRTSEVLYELLSKLRRVIAVEKARRKRQT